MLTGDFSSRLQARIKAKPLLRNSFVPKNGFKAVPLSPQPQQYLPSLYNQTPTSAAPTAPPPQPPASPQSAPAAPQPTPPAPPQQQVTAQTMSQKFAYPSQVPSVHYITPQQVSGVKRGQVMGSFSECFG